MKQHWSFRYRGVKWADETNCFYWVRRILKEQFGREIPDQAVDCKHLSRSAVRLMSGNIMDLFGYVPTDTPREGDGVFMTQGNASHHIGLAVFPGGKFHVLHVQSCAGLVIADRHNLVVNGWKINGFYTPYEAAARS